MNYIKNVVAWMEMTKQSDKRSNRRRPGIYSW